MNYVPYAIGAIFGGIAIYGIYSNWRNIVAQVKGKKIAVLGAHGVGKTCLIKFLTEGTITAEYIQTLTPIPIKATKLDLRELHLRFRETIDVSGSISGSALVYGEWKEVFDDADIVLYLFRVDEIKKGKPETIKGILQDAKQIKQWEDDLNNRKRALPIVVVVGTFCDKDPEYNNCVPSTFGNYQDNFMSLSIVQQLLRHIDAKRWILGSMANSLNTEALAYRLFNTIKTLRR